MNQEEFMRGMSIQHLCFEVQAIDVIRFGDQAGSALRGALYQVLSDNFCSEPGEPVTPDHQERCPVCWLLAAEDESGQRGENVPRPLTVQPPALLHELSLGQQFTFGFSLIGAAQNLLPYLARAVKRMGDVGIGKGRGRFRLLSIKETNPLLDVERVLLEGNLVKQPTLMVTPAQITESLTTLPHHAVTLELITPLRLVQNGRLIPTPEPMPFMQRLIERCQNLAAYYAESETVLGSERWTQLYQQISDVATQAHIAYDETRWVEAFSGSRRQGRATPISGIVGRVRWEGNIKPLLPWLLWGQSLHVGKSTVKGNGWYQVIRRI